MALKENSKKVLEFVKSVDGVKEVTAADIADAVGLTTRQVNGIVTAAFQNHKILKGEEKVAQPLMKRVPAEIENADGTHKAVKFIQLTDEGRVFEDAE